jgi:hypothetical protein
MTRQQAQLDLFGARQARDLGMARVTDHSGWWFQAAMRRISELQEWRGTGEDLRLLITGYIGPPHHRNTWGALTAQAVKQGLLIKTGERRAMRTVKSHARQTDVYRTQRSAP